MDKANQERKVTDGGMKFFVYSTEPRSIAEPVKEKLYAKPCMEAIGRGAAPGYRTEACRIRSNRFQPSPDHFPCSYSYVPATKRSQSTNLASIIKEDKAFSGGNVFEFKNTCPVSIAKVILTLPHHFFLSKPIRSTFSTRNSLLNDA